VEPAQPILVTGATGFIGRRLVARLLERGLAVRALVLPDDQTPVDPRLQVVRGSHHRVPIRRAARELGLSPHVGCPEALEEIAQSIGR